MNEHYQFISHYADDEHWRTSLNALSQSLWGITVLAGGEKDYVPFSYAYENEIVANVSVGRFDCVIDNQKTPASMIQTVMTEESHRNRGLIRELFAQVQEHIQQTTGRTFFTANRNKQAFYGKFGYQTTELIDHFKWTVQTDINPKKVVKIDWTSDSQKADFMNALAKRAPVSNEFGFVERHWLLLWFIDHFHRENLYFLPELQAYVVCHWDESTFELKDVIAPAIPTWSDIQAYFPVKNGMEVRSYFVPDNLSVRAEKVVDDDDYFYFDDTMPLPAAGVCLPDTQRG
jgi:GNAT superfamily N-acetyltransferase